MTTLHILSTSPFADQRLASCLRLLSPGDGLLLCGDAVYALNPDCAPRQTLELMPEQIALYALQEDLDARGLHDWPARLQVVDYPAFVALTLDYARSNSWL